MSSPHRHHRSDLVRIAFEAMVERGLAPVFPLAVHAQVDALTGPAHDADPHIRDLRALPWCSLDNDDSMDLDQLTVCEPLDHPDFRVRVAIADVDALVPKDSPVDAHARINTASVYTSAQVFPMLPTRLSNDLSSLNAHEDRLAIVTEFIVHREGTVSHAKVYRARVRNQAKLAYDAVSAWIDGEGGRTSWRNACASAATAKARWSWRPCSRAPCSMASAWWALRSRCRTGAAS